MKRIIWVLEDDAKRRMQIVERKLVRAEKKCNESYRQKMQMEEEAIKIFTLYEITKEITSTMNEESAFEIFKKTLAEHVSFSKCYLSPADSEEIKHLKKMDEYFVFPLIEKRKKLGFLVAEGIKDEDKEKIRILGHQFALALRRVKLYQEIEKTAITDGLTEVYTRHYVLDRLEEEIQRSQRRKVSMSFLMLDVDFFKKFNDTYGHLTGDQILKRIGGIIKESIREIDIAGRYGGEEFCIVLPETDRKGALLAAERIRITAEKSKIQAYDHSVKATVSIGLVTFPDDGNKVNELIDKADWALYRSKKQGRNRITSFGVYDEEQKS